MKRPRIHPLWLALFLLCANLWAASPKLIRESVVKIVSKVSGTGKEFRGSGILFSHAGKRYVISSDHVVFHIWGTMADTKATSSETGEELSLTLISAEWGNGLALLSVEGDKTPKPTLTLDDLVASPPVAGSPASVYGYPFDSTGLEEESGAKTLSPISSQNFFFFVPQLVELTATVGEFGMSGGGAFSAKGEFIGVLSHQKVVKDDENHLFAIPSQTVVAWIREYLAKPDDFNPYFSEPWWAQGLQTDGGLMLSNDGVLIGQKIMDGVFRNIAVSLDNPAMLLKDGPTRPYVDQRKLWPALRALIQKDKERPVEFSLLRVKGDGAELQTFTCHTAIFEAAKASDTLLFVAIGWLHEERYDRIKKALDKLHGHGHALAAVFEKETTPSSQKLLDDLLGLEQSFAPIPAKSTEPPSEAAFQYFTQKWLSDAYYRLLALERNPAWSQVAKTDAALAKQAKEDLAAAVKALDVRLITSSRD